MIDKKIMNLAQEITNNTLEKIVLYSLISYVFFDINRSDNSKSLYAVMEILNRDAKKIRMMIAELPYNSPSKEYWGAINGKLSENDLNKVLLNCFLSLYEYSETHNIKRTISSIINNSPT